MGSLPKPAGALPTADLTWPEPPAPQTPPLADGPALDLYDIVKTWRGAGRVLDHAELTAYPGDAIHISGRNGTGKTTLLKIAVGLIQPDQGKVSSAGLSPGGDRRRYQQRVGYLSAGDRTLYARMSVRDHLRFWARINFIPRSLEPIAVDRALARFELEALADRRVDRLSMGQRQRARLAGSFIHDPSVVLLDEPRNSLDEEAVALLICWLADVLRRGGSVIWCSPSGETTGLRFTHRYLLADGRLRRQ